jgi:hypothetical protein
MVGRVLPVSSFIVFVSYYNYPTQNALENLRTQYVYGCEPDFIKTLPRQCIFSELLPSVNFTFC